MRIMDWRSEVCSSDLGAALPRGGGTMNALFKRVEPLGWTVLPPAAAVAMMAMIVGALVAAPREIIEGEVQRLMYLPVPAAVTLYGAFILTAAARLAERRVGKGGGRPGRIRGVA